MDKGGIKRESFAPPIGSTQLLRLKLSPTDSFEKTSSLNPRPASSPETASPPARTRRPPPPPAWPAQRGAFGRSALRAGRRGERGGGARGDAAEDPRSRRGARGGDGDGGDGDGGGGEVWVGSAGVWASAAAKSRAG